MKSFRVIHIARKSIHILPVCGILYFLGTVVAIAIILFCLERLYFPHLEALGIFPSKAWRAETSWINAHTHSRQLSTDADPVLKTVGHPAAHERTKKYRILVAGDSFVWGDGLANYNDIWWRQLERVLISRGYHDVEVIAVGEDGASTRRELNLVKRIYSDYHPDIIVWGYVTNDPDEGLVPVNSSIPVTSDRIEDRMYDSVIRKYGAALFPYTTTRIENLRQRKLATLLSNSAGFGYGQWELELLKSPNIEKYKETVQDVAAFHASNHVPFFFMTLPNFPEASYFTPRYDGVKKLFTDSGIEFLDVLPEFLKRDHEHPELSYVATPFDGHPGPVSAAFFAEQAANHLERNFAQFLGAKSTNAPSTVAKINDWVPQSVNVKSIGENQYSLMYRDPVSCRQMPLREPYIQLNFEMPCAIDQIELSGAYLNASHLYVNALPPGALAAHDLPLDMGQKSGNKILWNLGDLKKDTRINSLKIVVTMSFDKLEFTEQPLPTTHLVGDGGYCWVAQLSNLNTESDDETGPQNSKLIVLENGQPLPAPHSIHDEIRAKGLGGYSHWKGQLLFSASDNSTPGANGKTYSIKYPQSNWRELHLRVIPKADTH